MTILGVAGVKGKMGDRAGNLWPEQQLVLAASG